MTPVSSYRAPLEVGTQIGSYLRIESLLGVGATAEVYRAKDERSDRLVALKHHLVRAGNERNAALLRAQFEREFYWLCQLKHPRIIEVYDFVIDAHGAFYSMELLDGQDLREGGTVPWRAACALLLDLASSLAILHSRGLVHRDVSPANVRYTAAGRVKLIDFGAMTSFGPATSIIGTPAYTAPEVLQLQSLDGRADLYSLGALAYWMLTGRAPFTARTLQELAVAWQHPPKPLLRVLPSLPEALDQLVMELLQLERSARPSNAAEIMSRLSAIAELDYEEIDVGRAYLVTPRLIARDEAQAAIKRQLAEARAGRQSVTFVEGAAGSGRSRLLDVSVLEAKVTGACVLRADATHGPNESYAVARALVEQLMAASAEFGDAPGLSADVAGWIAPAESAPPERPRLLSALRAWIGSLAEIKPITIAVDDVDAIDEPSAALLTLLASGTDAELSARMSLQLVFAAEAGAQLVAALSEVRAQAVRVELAAFELEATRQLVNSLFGGELPHSLVERIHQLSEGFPRAIMGLCEWLVDHGSARYRAGGWSVPPELKAEQLPNSMIEELAARVAQLSPDARELGEALSLTNIGLLSVVHYSALCEHADQARVYRALDELVARGVLARADNGYRFRQRELIGMLGAPLTAARSRQLHRRIARSLEGTPHTLPWISHMLQAGELESALSAMEAARDDSTMEVSSFSLALTRELAQAAEVAGVAHARRQGLYAAIAGMAVALGEYALCVQYGVPLLERLQRDSGLADFFELEDLPESARLPEALRRTQERYDATPEAERGWGVVRSIQLLGRLRFVLTGMAHSALDLPLFERIPSLAPLQSLSPALAVAELTAANTQSFLTGRFGDAPEARKRLVERMDAPDGGGLPGPYRTGVRATLLYSQGLAAASLGQADAAAAVAELEDAPGYRANAWRVRMVLALMQGDAQAALACKRKAELLQTQDTGLLRFAGTTARVELFAHVLACDERSVNSTLPALAELARKFPCWRVDYLIGCSHAARLRRDFAAALAAAEEALSLASPGGHPDWAIAAAAHLWVLHDAGRSHQAATLGDHYSEVYAREKLSGSLIDLLRPHAEALAQIGEAARAVELAERCLLFAHERRATGLILGACFETRARVALAADDSVSFRECVARCAEAYQLGRNRSLTTRHEQLLREGERRGWWSSKALSGLVHGGTSDAELLTSIGRMLEGSTGKERFQRVLQLLVAGAGSVGGYLFGLRAGGLQLLAAVGAPEPTDALVTGLQCFLDANLGMDDEFTQVVSDTLTTASPPSAVLPAFEPVLLTVQRGDSQVVAGVAALAYDAMRVERRALDRRVSASVAAVTLECLEAQTR